MHEWGIILNYKLGLVSVSFRKNTCAEVLMATKESGLSCVEWGSDIHAPVNDISKLKSIAKSQDKYGIFCSSYGTYFRVMNNATYEINDYIDAAQILGTDVLRIWCGDKDFRDYSEGELFAIREECRRLADIAENRGVTLCAECHNNTVTSCADGALWLMKSVSSPYFRMYWQPNQYISFKDNVNFAKKIAKYTKYIHTFNWVENNRFPLKDAINKWRDYLSCFDDDKTLLLEFMPDDKIESLYDEACALKVITGELK